MLPCVTPRISHNTLKYNTPSYNITAKKLLDEKNLKYTGKILCDLKICTFIVCQCKSYASVFAVIELDKEEDGKAIRAVMGDTLGR